jgi:hypothetical protein
MTLSELTKKENDIFNKFLLENSAKINAITPKNPSISKDDEWRTETFWDEEE